MIWILNVCKDFSQLCDILNAGINDVLIAKEAKRKMWCIQVLTIIVFLEVNDLVQVKGNDVVCKGQRVIQEVVIVPLSENVCVLHFKLVESHLRHRSDVGLSNNA
jgi:hypothetical protein